MRKIFLIFLSILYFSSLPAQIFSTMTDNRDGKTYKTVIIGKNEWMAQNLNYKNTASWCYNNDPANCDKYGRLYSYTGAAQACPSGWYLSSAKDWDRLIEEIGQEDAAALLKEGGSIGFNALMAGMRYEHGDFNYLNQNAYFWSKIYADNEPAWVYLIGSTMFSVTRIKSFSGNGFSVRCVKR